MYVAALLSAGKESNACRLVMGVSPVTVMILIGVAETPAAVHRCQSVILGKSRWGENGDRVAGRYIPRAAIIARVSFIADDTAIEESREGTKRSEVRC